MTIQEILQIPVFKGACVTAGETGMNNEVLFTTIMDIPNLYEWLNGGELVCAGVLFQQCLSDQFLRDLKHKNIAGIVSKAKFMKGMTPELNALCDELKLPIIIVPERYNWSEVMNPVITAIVQKQYDIINQTQKFHDILMEFLLQNEPISMISEKVFQTCGLTVAIVNSGLDLISQSSNLPWSNCISGMRRDNLIPRDSLAVTVDGGDIPGYLFRNRYLTTLDKKLFLYEIIQAGCSYGYIMVAVSCLKDQLSTQEIMEMQQLSLITALYMSKKNAVDNATRKYNNLLLDEILRADSIDDINLDHISRSLGATLETNYYIAIIHSSADSDMNILLLNQYTDQFYRNIKEKITQSEKLLLFENGHSFILFIGGSYVGLDTLLKKVEAIYCQIFHAKKAFIGISMLNPFPEARRSYQQALQALNYAEKYDRVKHCFYSDLGVLRFFMDQKNSLSMEYLQEHYDRYILPLKEYDRKNHTQLFETITCYMKNNCSKVQTAKELFIHKNTLLARISTLEKTIHCDLGNAEDIFNLQMAMKIDHFLSD